VEDKPALKSRSRLPPWLIVLILTLTIQVLTRKVLPRFLGLNVYVANPLLWFFLAIAALAFFGREKDRRWLLDRSILMLALTIAIFQIAFSFMVGVFTSFGRSPYVFTPTALTVNLIYFISSLLGFEFARAYLIKSWSRRPTLAIGLTAFLYSPMLLFFPFKPLEPLEATRFLCSSYLPALAQSSLASYLAFIGGPISSIFYLGVLEAFEWISPILPDPSWSIKGLVGVLAPTIGFLVAHQATLQQTEKAKMEKKFNLQGWTVVAMLCVLAVWISTGQLGIYPAVVSSGSMQPTLEVGDLVLAVKTQPDRIRLGDIVQFYDGEMVVIHRVVGFQQKGDQRLFITKGDANPNPDLDPVPSDQVIGKVVFTVPKVGWVTIIIKNVLNKVYQFFQA